MTDTPQDRKKDVICVCSGTTREQIRRLTERGVTDFEGISQASGAGSGCGGCDTDILQLIADYVERQNLQY